MTMSDAGLDPAFRSDPNAPLPGAPEPWASSSMPSRRGAPPFHMTEMIEAEPRLAVRILDRLLATDGPRRLASALRIAASAGRPIVTVGCGTSEHGAQGVAEILRDALREAGLAWAPAVGGGPIPIQAFEASLIPGLAREGAVVIGVSHEGATAATNAALRSARDAGATVAIITASAGSPGAALASIVLETVELDQSWCHTVGYLSPLVAGLAVATELTGTYPDAAAVEAAVGAGLRPTVIANIEAVAGAMAARDRVVVVGTGVDRTAARELTLKIEEGTHRPAAMRDLEALLHGHLAGMDGRTGAVLIEAGRDGRGPRVARARQALAALRSIDVTAGAILSADAAGGIPTELTPAGRVVVAEASTLPSAAAALLSTAVPLQLLTERMARVLDVDPDPIRRDEPAYLAAAAAAEAADDPA